MYSSSNSSSRSSSFSSTISTPFPLLTRQGVSQAESAVNQLIDDLRNEQSMILIECAKLSRFLRANAITAYNDDTIEYMKYHIEEEKRKQQEGTENSEVIQGLETALESFKQEMKLFDQALTDGNASTTATDMRNRIPQLEEIFPLIERLYALPINGNSIRQQVEGLRSNQQASVKRREETIVLTPSGMASIIAAKLSQPSS